MTERETAEVRLIASQRNWIEGTAVQQLENTASLPGMRLAVGLPDLHPGKGSPIGAAFAVEGYLYPALVGNDIGCGVGLWRTRLSARKLKREAWADRLHNLDSAWDGDVSTAAPAGSAKRSCANTWRSPGSAVLQWEATKPLTIWSATITPGTGRRRIAS